MRLRVQDEMDLKDDRRRLWRLHDVLSTTHRKKKRKMTCSVVNSLCISRSLTHWWHLICLQNVVTLIFQYRWKIKLIQNLVKYYLYISGDDHNSSTRNEELDRLFFFAVKMTFMNSSMIKTCIQIRQWQMRVIKTRHLKCKRHQIEKTRMHLWRTDSKRDSIHFTCVFLLYQKTWLFDSWHWKIYLYCHALRWHQRSSSILFFLRYTPILWFDLRANIVLFICATPVHDIVKMSRESSSYSLLYYHVNDDYYYLIISTNLITIENLPRQTYSHASPMYWENAYL